MTAQGAGARPVELRIDRIRCDGYGMCAELLPELLGLDDWGYPIVAAEGVPAGLVGHAQRAVAACPVLALRLVPRTPAGRATLPGLDRVRSAAGG
jgi:ferredoxin